ncbi:MAG: glycosyltransferase family 4 protein [Chitinophagaceae bacterium]|nr:glycosyltransferase family 4 protein [Chitinophagaceae bacterium]MCW5929137.1 glycosyltransferase family 4 protein [Chitinophagaceae bacterium]
MLKLVSIASYQFLPPETGGQKGIALFNRYFAKHLSFTCLSVPENAANNTEDYPIVPLLGSGKFRYINPFVFFRVRNYIRRHHITHVLLEHPYYGWLGWLLKKTTHVRLVVHSHNIEALRFRDVGKWWWKILWGYERATLRGADTCFFISEEDRQYAIQQYGVQAEQSIVITYGIEQNSPPSHAEKMTARQTVAATHGLDTGELLLMFSATFNYGPNLKALDNILTEINPLLKDSDIRYKIIICGSRLPEDYRELKDYKKDNIIFAGFVDDIQLYFNAADIFLNPLSEGGGIKTKLVEALAANTSAVSYANGALGVPGSVTGEKLRVVNDHDAAAFADAVKQVAATINNNIPPTFFDHFYWNNITKKAAEKLRFV